jgi:thiol-disulfide isomerase/thioredoxin
VRRALSAAVLVLLLLGCLPLFARGSRESSPPPSSAAAPAAGGGSPSAASALTQELLDNGFAVPAREVASSDFTLSSLDGRSVSLSDFRGKLVILSFWATWCGPCKQEIPSLEALYSKLQDRGLVVLAVDVDARETRQVVADFAQANGMSFPVLLDSQSTVAGMYIEGSIPTNYLIDRTGKVLGRVVGFDGTSWTSPQRMALFEKLLQM